VGLLRVRDCCLFTWRDAGDRKRRTVIIEPRHCRHCIAELRRVGAGWQIVVASPSPSPGGEV